MVKTFGEFRTKLARCMRAVGCDPWLCSEVGYLDHEGEVAALVYRHWDAYRDMLSDETDESAADSAIHDCVIDLVCDYCRNQRNEAPAMAEAAVEFWFGK